MKALFVLSLFLFNCLIFAQTELENLSETSIKICEKEKESSFCKAFNYYKVNAHDSCYIFSSKALIHETNKEKIDILNYFQGYSAIQKNLLKKALLNINKISDSGGLKNLKKIKLGYIYLKKKLYKKSIKNYLELVDIKSELNKNQLMNTYHNLGINYLHIREHSKAKKYLNEELNLISYNDTASVIALKTDLANIYYQQYLDEEAIALFYEAYYLANDFSELEKKRISTKNIAVIEYNRSRYKESVYYYRKLINLKDSISNRDRIWELAELDKKNVIQSKQQELLVQNEKLKQQELIILALLVVSILILVIGYLIYQNRKKRLLFKTEIQKLKLVEEERKRISEELHDGVLGKLFGIRINLGLMNGVRNKNQLKNYNSYLEELQQVEKEIRNVSHELGANIPEISNFTLVIEKLMESKSEQGNFKYNIENNQEINYKVFETGLLLNVYRVLQEVLHNIVKHAKANHVSLLIQKEEKTLFFKVEDNGVGFYIEAIENKGIGIKNIISRIKKIKGEITVDSKIDIGTTIKLRIPF